MNKKASITISMSWIFMIIVGAFFLILAYNIIDKYQKIEQEKFNYELKNALRTQFNKVGRTAGVEETKLETLKNIFSDKKIEMICQDDILILCIDENCESRNEFLENNPTFMSIIKQKKREETYLAVESYNFPFKSSNLMAIISKKNLIVFDNNSQISRKFVDKFKRSSYSDLTYIVKDFNLIFTSGYPAFLNSINNKNFNSVVFVTDWKGNSKKDDFIESNIFEDVNFFVYEIKFKEENQGGNLTYIWKEKDKIKTSSYNYVDFDNSLSLQTMAIFSSPQVFDCSYNILLKNILNSYKFYIKKTQLLINISASKWICSKSLGKKFNQIQHYKNLLNSINETYTLLKKKGFKKIDKINSDLTMVEQSSRKLEEISCVYVY